VNNIIVNPILCNGCKTCYHACFADVIRWDASAKRPIIAYPRECAHCGYCELLCKQQAIRVVVDYDAWMFPREKVSTALQQEGI
jgi:NAD-dependent dihydropyrimidine dehydrogenase PreA subunit